MSGSRKVDHSFHARGILFIIEIVEMKNKRLLLLFYSSTVCIRPRLNQLKTSKRVGRLILSLSHLVFRFDNTDLDFEAQKIFPIWYQYLTYFRNVIVSVDQRYSENMFVLHVSKSQYPHC